MTSWGSSPTRPASSSVKSSAAFQCRGYKIELKEVSQNRDSSRANNDFLRSVSQRPVVVAKGMPAPGPRTMAGHAAKKHISRRGIGDNRPLMSLVLFRPLRRLKEALNTFLSRQLSRLCTHIRQKTQAAKMKSFPKVKMRV